MTIAEYITGKIEGFGIYKMSDSDLLDILEKNSMNAEDDVTKYNVRQRELAFLGYVPDLLLYIDSIDESGFRISRSDAKDKIMKYYSLKCQELGVEDKLNTKVVIKNASNRW